MTSVPLSRAFFLSVALLTAGCGDADRRTVHELAGAVMGTTFTVKVVAPPGTDMAALRIEVERAIRAVDETMSTYRPDSELSRFNASTQTGWLPASAAFCNAVADALALSRQSGGAFDPTIGPVVGLWGFGPEVGDPVVPHDEQVAETMTAVGWQRLHADCGRPALKKELPALHLDLSAFAKGYAVDRAAEIVAAAGIADYLVEIGGELRLAGRNSRGERWAIAIERPAFDERAVQTVFELSDTGIATSGDYRNYFEYGGRNYSHTIDPRTGRPVDHALASVTVLDELAATADGWATALLVLGPDDGLALANRKGVAAFFVVRDGGVYAEFKSASFDASVESWQD